MSISWILYFIGGAALLGGSMFLVNHYDLKRTGLFRPFVTGGPSLLPTIGAILLAIAGAALLYYGLRAR